MGSVKYPEVLVLSTVVDLVAQPVVLAVSSWLQGLDNAMVCFICFKHFFQGVLGGVSELFHGFFFVLLMALLNVIHHVRIQGYYSTYRNVLRKEKKQFLS